MASYDFKAQRLFCDAPLTAGVAVVPDRDQTHYLLNVLRLDVGAELLVFNGRDGEWLTRVAQRSKRALTLEAVRQVRAQTLLPPLDYLFAPLKRARLDYMVQKATEMGASRLRPVITQHTQVTRVKGERLRANVIEAAEQCGLLALPIVDEPQQLHAVLAGWGPDRPLIFCDEGAPEASPLTALRDAFSGMKEGAKDDAHNERGPGVLIGPEGGFSEAERSALLAMRSVVVISLGPRILRADTAAVAALALVQATLAMP
ncbi:MAG: 16S rRNA (uracil(1498)-N(3))-methyltransferase [Pseudomonadota bacterium]